MLHRTKDVVFRKGSYREDVRKRDEPGARDRGAGACRQPDLRSLKSDPRGRWIDPPPPPPTLQFEASQGAPGASRTLIASTQAKEPAA